MALWKKLIIAGGTLGVFFALPVLASIFLPFQGGTGSGVTPTNGQIPIGNGTGTYTPANLLGSGGVTITNASGSVTINQAAAPATTTINQVVGPTFTISIVTTSSEYSITTTTAQLFLNLLASSTFLKTSNNLSDLSSTSSARTNIGFSGFGPISISALGAIVFTNPGYLTNGNNLSDLSSSSTALTNIGALAVANNLSDLKSTSTARTNIGYTGGNKITISATGTIGLTTSSISQFSNDSGYVTSTGSPVTGSSTYIQYNEGGNSGATSTLTYTSSTHVFTTMGLGVPTIVANSAATSVIFSFTGATSSFSVPAHSGNVTLSAGGSVGRTGLAGTPPGKGGTATGTIALAANAVLYYGIGLNGSGTPVSGGMSWISTSSFFNSTNSSTVLLVAGGGADGGDASCGGGSVGNGGDAGGLTGSAGSQGGSGSGGLPGGGASQTSGGSSGGGNATAGNQPNGGTGDTTNSCHGGRGGSGYFGGGGGQSVGGQNAGGGGGGSSFMSPSLSATSTSSGVQNNSGTVAFGYNAFPTISGNDTAFHVIAVATMSTATITFASPNFTNNPSCWITPNNATTTYFAISTTSTLAITFDKALTVGQSFDAGCQGY